MVVKEFITRTISFSFITIGEIIPKIEDYLILIYFIFF